MSNETRRIMLVEDEKAIRDAVAAYLERENYWVSAVGDGQEALEEFSKHHFDLVILDLMLPHVPGERVCRALTFARQRRGGCGRNWWRRCWRTARIST